MSDPRASEFATDHHRWRLDASRIVDALGGRIAAMSAPMVSDDAVAFHLLSDEVSRSRKVVQSGQGADEVLGGYSWYPHRAGADGLGTDEYARVFFDRGHEDLAEFLADEQLVGEDVGRAFVEVPALSHLEGRVLDRTNLDGSALWQLGLHELWLEEQGL